MRRVAGLDVLLLLPQAEADDEDNGNDQDATAWLGLGLGLGLGVGVGFGRRQPASVIKNDATPSRDDERKHTDEGFRGVRGGRVGGWVGWEVGEGNARGGSEGLGHRFAVAWERVRAAFGDG